jgi:heptosyltransferase-2
VLFGPTAVEKTNLNLEGVAALFEKVACRPCYLRTCPIDHRCLTRLAPERVVAAALPALSR